MSYKLRYTAEWKDVQNNLNQLYIYKDTDDLISKIRFYLKHEQDRECIIDKGYEYISQNHTFINRIEEIISICDI